MSTDAMPKEYFEFFAEHPDAKTVERVAQQLGMSRQGIYSAIQRGDLTAVRLPVPFRKRPVYFVRQSDVDAFLENPPPIGRPPKKNS